MAETKHLSKLKELADAARERGDTKAHEALRFAYAATSVHLAMMAANNG